MKKILVILIVFASISLQAGIGEGTSQEGPLPVELTSFSATVIGNVVQLNWTTATEINNYGFEIERSTNLGNLRGQGTHSGNSDLEGYQTLGFVEGHGNSNSPKKYSFIDASVNGLIVSYRLKQIDTDGKFEYSSVIELQNNLPNGFALKQNYPNPFNPTTVISYTIPKTSNVTLKIFNVLGKTITTLVNERQEIGTYNLNFNSFSISGGLPSGIYFYKITAEKFSSVKKMILMK